MPTPAKFDAVFPFSEREECLQNTMASCDSSVFSKDGLDPEGADLPLVVVDKEKIHAESVKDDPVERGETLLALKIP